MLLKEHRETMPDNITYIILNKSHRIVKKKFRHPQLNNLDYNNRAKMSFHVRSL